MAEATKAADAAAALAATKTAEAKIGRVTGTATVTVACKLPNGIILQNSEMFDVAMPVMGGGTRNTQEGRKVGPEVQLRGFTSPQGLSPEWTVVGGYGITPDVDAAFMERWMSQNKDSPMVKNRIIFIAEKTSLAMGQAKEQKAVVSGLERMDPDNLPQEFKRSRFKIETENDRPASSTAA